MYNWLIYENIYEEIYAEILSIDGWNEFIIENNY